MYIFNLDHVTKNTHNVLEVLDQYFQTMFVNIHFWISIKVLFVVYFHKKASRYTWSDKINNNCEPINYDKYPANMCLDHRYVWSPKKFHTQNSLCSNDLIYTVHLWLPSSKGTFYIIDYI